MILNIHQKSRIIENEKIPWDTIVNQVLLSLQSNFGGDPGDLGIHRSKHAKNLGLDTLTEETGGPSFQPALACFTAAFIFSFSKYVYFS